MSLRVDVLTLFPEMFEGVFGSSILGKAQEKGIASLHTLNFRAFANNKHMSVDDTPFGGGGGMVIKPEPIFAAVESLIEQRGENSKPRVILMCPQGERFSQAKAEELSQENHLIFVCGHYEGIDERVREHLVTDELSVGDFVLTGGELAAMTMIDAVVRLLPGALGNSGSARSDSFACGLLEYPQYTRPAEFRGWVVPDVLLSGHHANVEKWRREQAIARTFHRRPDLLEGIELSKKERQFLEQLQRQALTDLTSNE